MVIFCSIFKYIVIATSTYEICLTQSISDALEHHVFDMDVGVLRAIVSQASAPAKSMSSKAYYKLVLFVSHF
jgi:hypothetical protein